MTKEQLKIAIDQAASTAINRLFSVLQSNLADNDKNATEEFQHGLGQVLVAHAIATAAVESL